MKIIFISDIKEIRDYNLFSNLSAEFEYSIGINVPGSKLYDIAETIKSKTDVDIIIIDAHLLTSETEFLQEMGGIELMKYLRLLGVQTHCILYSPLTTEQILRLAPGNLIITSKGTTLVNSEEIFSYHNFQEKACIKADSDLKPFIKVDFQMPDEGRHNWANWWGIERLWQVHQSVINKEKEDFKEYTESPFTKKLHSLNALSARYIYPINENIIKELQKDEEIKELIKEKNELSNLLRNIKNISNTTKSTHYRKINEITEKINNLRNNVETGDLLKDLRNEILNDKKKIVYFDDQAKDGWSTIFQMILYGNINECCFKTPDNVNENYILQYITEDIDIVLLDLRLKQEDNVNQDVKKLSGAIVLEKIIERHPGLPVIIITASNKVKSYEMVINTGADAYWVKEGIDSQFTEEETFNNYKLFLELINKLSGDEYKLLKHFAKRVDDLKNNPYPWWSKHHWNCPEFTNNIAVERIDGKHISEVTKYLDYGIFLYREWLKKFVLKNDETNNEKSKLQMLANIINSLSNIIEIIHKEMKWNKNISVISNEIIGGSFLENNVYKENRGDYIAFYLNEFRNIASHYSGNIKVTYELYKTFIKGILTWITTDRFINIKSIDIGVSTYKEWKEIKFSEDTNLLIIKFEEMINKYNVLSNIYNNL